jgi:hypothetical protein
MRSTMENGRGIHKDRSAALEARPRSGFGLELCDQRFAEFARIREGDGGLRLVKGLTPQWVNVIRSLLTQIGDANARTFDQSITALLLKGYRLTSLVAELSYDPDAEISGSLQCDVRPKIGAKPAFPANSYQSKKK